MYESRRSRLYWISAILLPISFVLYVTSLTMNVALVRTEIKILGMGQTTEEPIKLLSTIQTLWEANDFVLAIIITAFTIVFPIGKYLALGWVLRFDREPLRSRIHTWVKNLGQWSMGDVFVVALTVVIVRVNNSIAQLQVLVQPGLFLFTASVLTSMIVSVLLSFDQRTERVSARVGARSGDATDSPPPESTAGGEGRPSTAGGSSRDATSSSVEFDRA